MNIRSRLLLLLWLTAGLAACGGGGSSGPEPTIPPPSVVQKGARILEVQVSEPESGDFMGAFNLAQSIGVESVSLSFDWSAIDIGTDPISGAAIYADDASTDFLAIANACYPNSGTRLSLMLRPITTLVRKVPPGFENMAWDDPLMIDRFQRFMDHVFVKIPEIDIAALAIGSEVDLHFVDSVTEQQYLTFYAAISDYARARYAQLYPAKASLKVTVEVTHKGLLDPTKSAYYQQLNQTSDVIGVSYYPLDAGLVEDPSVVAQDFADMLALYPGKNLHFFQLGYPSGYYSATVYPEFGAGSVTPSINSTAELQAEFIDAVFAAWDQNATRINQIGFTWMHDETEADVAATVADPAFGGTTNPSPDFVEFLRTLGLRTDAATDKPAWTALSQRGAERGWSDTGQTLDCS